MKRKMLSSLALAFIGALACLLLFGCGGGSTTELKDLRELSWEGDELTVTVGTNKSTGCEWTTKFEDDSIIGYSINRKFKLSDAGASKGEAVGTSAIGYKGKSAGTAKIFMSTAKDWEGNEPGYTYTVTVTVNADGTIADATGE